MPNLRSVFDNEQLRIIYEFSEFREKSIIMNSAGRQSIATESTLCAQQDDIQRRIRWLVKNASGVPEDMKKEDDSHGHILGLAKFRAWKRIETRWRRLDWKKTWKRRETRFPLDFSDELLRFGSFWVIFAACMSSISLTNSIVGTLYRCNYFRPEEASRPPKLSHHEEWFLCNEEYCHWFDKVRWISTYSNEASSEDDSETSESEEFIWKVKWKSSFSSFPRFLSIKSSSSCFYSFLRFNFANIRVIFPFSCLQVSLKHFSLVSWIFHVLWEDRNISMSMTWKTWRWHSK